MTNEHSSNIEVSIEKDAIQKGFSEYHYGTELLTYLLSLLDNDDKEILLQIYEATTKNVLNYQKTKVPNYQKLRRKYEISWGKLEAQGLIKPVQLAQMRLFVITVNGEKAVELLKNQETIQK